MLQEDRRERESPDRAAKERLWMNSLLVKVLFRIPFVLWCIGWRLGFDLFEFRRMGIMTMDAEKVSPFPGACKIARPFTVESCFPVFIDIAVAFATKPVAFGEIDQVSIIESQFIPFRSIVAIKTPPKGFSMVKPDLRML